jgi:hypothetical protein
MAPRFPVPGRRQPPARDHPRHRWRPPQGLTPGGPRGADAGLRPTRRRVFPHIAPRGARRLQPQPAPARPMGPPPGRPSMRPRAPHRRGLTGEPPRRLESPPALRREGGAVRARPGPTRVGPEARPLAVRTGVDLAAQGGGPARHDGARGAPHVAGQQRGLRREAQRVLEDRLSGARAHPAPAGAPRCAPSVAGEEGPRIHARRPRDKR